MTSIKYSALNKCQTCLGELTEKSTIKSLNLTKDMESLLTFFNVKIINGLLNFICVKCVSTLESIIKFKQQCNVSQTILQKLYEEYTSTNKDKPSKLMENVISLTTAASKEIKLENSTIKEEMEDDLNFSDNYSEKNIENNENELLSEIKQNESVIISKSKSKILCATCDFRCDTQDELTDHSQNKHDTVCNICNKKLVSNSNLRRHREIHQTNRPTQFCEICKKFYGKQTYECHMKIFHSDNHREKIVCTLCGISVYGIKSHMKSKHSETTNKLTCTNCDKVFKSSTTLRCHTLVYHESPENYKSLCPECGRVFRRACDMKEHLKRIHWNERKFKCHQCDKTFKRSFQRSRHEKIVHFNERNYKCEICSKAFTDKSVLQNHVRIHTGEKPFICSLCSRAFSQKAALRTHLKLVHGIQKVKLISNK